MELCEIKNQIKNMIENKVKMSVDFNELLLDQGIDSINIIELVVEIEEKFNFEFEESMLSYTTLRSINSISEYVLKRINGN